MIFGDSTCPACVALYQVNCTRLLHIGRFVIQRSRLLSFHLPIYPLATPSTTVADPRRRLTRPTVPVHAQQILPYYKTENIAFAGSNQDCHGKIGTDSMVTSLTLTKN